MKLHRLNGDGGNGYATFGCMWERGRCLPGTDFICINQAGQQVPIQSRITAYWPDGSLKWTAHTGNITQLGDTVEVLPADKPVPDISGIRVKKTPTGWLIATKHLTLDIPEGGQALFTSVTQDSRVVAVNGRAELLLEEPDVRDGRNIRIEKPYTGAIEKVELEELGPLQITVKYTGTHVDDRGDRKLPFIIRMRINNDDTGLRFMHTFLYDGDENKDYLKGIGIAFDAPMQGAVYNRHMKFAGDHGVFHEVMASLVSWRPRLPEALYATQIAGEPVHIEDEQLGRDVQYVMANQPWWSRYDICQDSAEHFVIRKKLALPDACSIDALHGRRAVGSVALGCETGSVMVSVRDFWEKYPTGYTVQGLDSNRASCHIWFWHPDATVMDFRHYAERGYNQVCYEGYDYKGADPDGIACTNECTIAFLPEMIPGDDALLAFARQEQEETHYVAAPQVYHDLGAFGCWSLPRRSTELETWLETQLDQLFAFYSQEVEQRGWYGMFNYGDFMHTYDAKRHQWKYDVGGYAWDNTELVPTLWLWTYFLRTGRADAFRLAEKLSRHAADVDVYHTGRYKGLGSRHNVRHWGCPCKEARIAMAHHHRVFYYLTGDLRMTDIFEELKDNELSFLNKDPLGDFYDKSAMVYPSHARSGPDWSSLCSNWLTQWERTVDTAYRDKMLVGMADIKAAPLQLISGPDFEFDPATVHLRYIGERTTGGTHLQICMGAPSIWMEMADLLDDEEWRQMMAAYGRFYYLPTEQKQQESKGLIGSREFSLPFMAAAMGAYGAAYLHDPETARRTWAVLLHTLLNGTSTEGFAVVQTVNAGNRVQLTEIPWITTNFAAQFGINVIMALDLIRDQLPATLAEANDLVRNEDPWFYHKA